MENNYSVYMHIFPNGKRYIGITSNEVNRRWEKGSGYKKQAKMKNAINKYGWENIEHIVLLCNLSKEEACKKEIESKCDDSTLYEFLLEKGIDNDLYIQLMGGDIAFWRLLTKYDKRFKKSSENQEKSVLL